MEDIRLVHGDALAVLPTVESDSIDSLVSDPPAGIGFMNKSFDSNRGGRERWIDWLGEIMSEVLRVLKPGAFGLVWALPRTSHWTATALEDAGFEIRDRISHLFGQGFPKAKSCLKPACEDWWLVRKPGKMQALQIDECRIMTPGNKTFERIAGSRSRENYRTGTTQGPAVESTLGRWPANVCLSHHEECNGDCHPDCPVRLLDEQSGTLHTHSTGNGVSSRNGKTNAYGSFANDPGRKYGSESGGASRFFAVFHEENAFLCHAKSIIETWLLENVNIAGKTSNLPSEHVVSVLNDAVTWASQGAVQLSDCQGLSTNVTPSELKTLCESVIILTLSSVKGCWQELQREKHIQNHSLANAAAILALTGTTTTMISRSTCADSAVVATFKNMSKSTAVGEADSPSRFRYVAKASRSDRGEGNTHPTVKSTALMRWLVQLVTPPGGRVLDCFLGSGTTMLACLQTGRKGIGIEADANYFAIAKNRIADALNATPLFADPKP